MNAPVIELSGLRKSFGSFELEIDELEIKAGEFVTVLGASGCGKSTLLRLIAGIEMADSGTITIDGTDATSLPPEKRPVNTVFQSYALFPHLDVRGNISFGLRAKGIAAHESKSRCDEAMELVQLSGHADKLPDELSGGMQQRVALARALVMRPKALLLDEPLSALDAQLREQMRSYLLELQRETGIAFVFVTHDQEEALSASERIILLDGGRIAEMGTPQQLYRRPKTIKTARALGPLTSVPANSNGSATLLCPALGDIPAPHDLDGDTATAAIRPENLKLVPGPPTDIGKTALRVVDEQFHGGTYMLTAKAPDGTSVVSSSAAPLGKAGRECHTEWAQEDLLLYDSEGRLVGQP